MNVKWSKSYPEAADRFAVSITDEDSPTGFSWASKTDAEVKSALGLPSKVYKAFVDCSGTSTPNVAVLQNTFEGTLIWSWSETGVVGVVSVDSEFTINKTFILTSINRSTTDRTITVVRDNILGASASFKTFQTDGNAVDSVDFFVTIEVYE